MKLISGLRALFQTNGSFQTAFKDCSRVHLRPVLGSMGFLETEQRFALPNGILSECYRAICQSLFGSVLKWHCFFCSNLKIVLPKLIYFPNKKQSVSWSPCSICIVGLSQNSLQDCRKISYMSIKTIPHLKIQVQSPLKTIKSRLQQGSLYSLPIWRMSSLGRFPLGGEYIVEALQLRRPHPTS